MSAQRVLVEADGGSRGNPGPAGYGAVVRDADSGEVLGERYASLGTTTNNVAEYTGLIEGLTAAAQLGAREVDVRMDSKLVIEQMSGRWQIRHPGLRPLAAQAAALMRRFDTVRFEWVPRSRNKHADALANRAMDEAASEIAAGPAVPARPRAVEPRAVEPRAVVVEPAVTAGAEAATGSGGEAGGPARGVGRPSWEPPAETPTRLILVRHGATALTAQRRYSGRGDVPLSAEGEAQARATGARLAAAGSAVAAVVTSPLSRAADTAALLAAALGDPPIQTDPDLIETDFGEWEGLTFAEVRRRWPEQMTRWLGSTDVAPPGGESFQEVDSRVRRAVVRLRERFGGRTLVVVSHVTPIKLLLRDALAAGDAFLYRLHLDAAGVSIVDSWPDGGVSVRTVNDTAHLAMRSDEGTVDAA